MKTITVFNKTNSAFYVEHKDSFNMLYPQEKKTISVDSDPIFIRRTTKNTAKIMVALERDNLSYATPSWGIKPVYYNEFDACFSSQDVINHVIIKENIYKSGVSGFALYKIFELEGKESILLPKFHSQYDSHLYNLLRLGIKIPIITVLCIIAIILFLIAIWYFELYLLLVIMGYFVVCFLFKKIFKEQKYFIDIEKNFEKLKNITTKINIVKQSKHCIVYKELDNF
jgi:hypothetical protein